jgi:hypothetical protein
MTKTFGIDRTRNPIIKTNRLDLVPALRDLKRSADFEKGPLAALSGPGVAVCDEFDERSSVREIVMDVSLFLQGTGEVSKPKEK